MSEMLVTIEPADGSNWYAVHIKISARMWPEKNDAASNILALLTWRSALSEDRSLTSDGLARRGDLPAIAANNKEGHP